MNRILIHTCCGPCFVGVYYDIMENNEIFKGKDVEISSLYYNPNIQPLVEYQRRKQTLEEFCTKVNCDLIVVDDYNLTRFVSESVNLDEKFESRCHYCYYTRLKKTFEYAQTMRYDSVMTTLSISPYQNQELIKKVGDELSKEYGIEYIHLDYTKIFRQGQKRAIEHKMYRQKYCGCVFSIDNGKWEY